MVGFAASWFATDACMMYVVPRIAQRPVYWGVLKCSVTLFPDTVGVDACGATPGMSSFGLFIATKVAATSAGPNAAPLLNFTPVRTVICRSLPPFWKAYAVANQKCVPADVGSS